MAYNLSLKNAAADRNLYVIYSLILNLSGIFYESRLFRSLFGNFLLSALRMDESVFM